MVVVLATAGEEAAGKQAAMVAARAVWAAAVENRRG